MVLLWKSHRWQNSARLFQFVDQPERERQAHAGQQARHQREMEAEIFPGHMDIARQPADPVPAHAGPQPESNQSQSDAEGDQ